MKTIEATMKSFAIDIDTATGADLGSSAKAKADKFIAYCKERNGGHDLGAKVNEDDIDLMFEVYTGSRRGLGVFIGNRFLYLDTLDYIAFELHRAGLLTSTDQA